MIGYLTQNYPLIHAFAADAPSARDAAKIAPRSHRGSHNPFPSVFKMAPQLSDLFSESEILALRGSLERPISGIAMDSRRVAPGNVFFALPGLRNDGA